MAAKDSGQTLVIEWSSGEVRAFAPGGGSVAAGATLSDVVSGRTTPAIIAVHQRAVLVRSMILPPAKKEDLERIARLKLSHMLSLETGDYVLSVHAGKDIPGKGKLCTVAAIKSETLRRIYREASQAGLQDVTVVPLATASAIAAKTVHMESCAVVERSGSMLSLDLVAEGQLRYSRTVSGGQSLDDLESEIARTFSVAGIPVAPILSSTETAIAAVSDDKRLAEYLAPPSSIRSSLQFELPEEAERKNKRAETSSIVRALVAACVTLGLAFYALYQKIELNGAPLTPAMRAAQDRTAKAARASIAESADTIKTAKVMETCLHPAQTFGDVLTVLSGAAPQDTWFSSVVISRGQQFTVRGQMTSGKDVAAFQKALTLQPRFKGVKLVSASKGQTGKRSYIDFILTGYPLGLSALRFSEGTGP